MSSFDNNGVLLRRSASTEALYRAVPTYVRRADLNGHMFGYVSVWGDHFHDLVDIILGLNLDEPTLADPDLIPPNWWPWLAAVCDYTPTTVPGAGLGSTPFARQRTRVADPRRLRRCTRWAIRETVRDLWPLATHPNVTLNPHWRGNRWVVRVRTDVVEVPDTGTSISTWGEYDETFATWGDIQAMAPSWFLWQYGIDRIHLLVCRALEAERPVGVKYTHNRITGPVWSAAGYWSNGGEWVV